MRGGCGYTVRCELQLLEISLQTMVDSTVCVSVDTSGKVNIVVPLFMCTS